MKPVYIHCYKWRFSPKDPDNHNYASHCLSAPLDHSQKQCKAPEPAATKVGTHQVQQRPIRKKERLKTTHHYEWQTFKNNQKQATSMSIA